MIHHNSISEIQTLLETYGLSLKKRFGQNFLIDAGARRRISGTIAEELAQVPENTGELWEIGPGIGSLTAELVQLGRPIRLFEIDHGLIRVLRDQYGDELAIEEGDFVRTVEAHEHAAPAAIVGNLPYSSASSMVARIIESALTVPVMVFLVQAELADRLGASVGGKEYSALSVLVQSHYTVRSAFDIGGGSFYPRPRVGSTVIILRAVPERPSREVSLQTSRIARRAFGQRRKTLRNTLRPYLEALTAEGIDPGLRPEQLTPAQFRDIARRVAEDDVGRLEEA
ncbi:MAG: 16S rRNA (adenine(1518)-N(6)/adenine(1519)-N(6))-dimethyltransferase RsmA [Alkalispirochaeta sp.]